MRSIVKKHRLSLGVLVSLLVSACAPEALVVPPPKDPPKEPVAVAPAEPAAPAAEDASFRKSPPPSGAEVPFSPPKIEEGKLSNGMRLLLVERRGLPIVALNIVVDRGGAEQSSPGVGSLLGGMLLQGTKKRSALALSDELEALGASYSAWTEHDAVVLTGQSLTDKLPEFLGILADVVQNPAFDKAELDRERAKRLTTIVAQNDMPSALMQNAVGERLYPEGHPYRDPLIGTEKSLKAAKQGDLQALYQSLFQPEHVTVTLAGDIDKATATALLEKAFGSWKGKAKDAKVVKDPPLPAKGEKRIFLIDRPGATQSMVAVSIVGVQRKNPDFDAIQVMNTLLGGQFSSRLNMNLREKHAYTYGARSAFDMRHGAGPFTAGGAIMTPATGPAITEIFSEIERIRKDDVGADELADAKANLIRQLPARFETTGETAGTLARLAIYGLPLDELSTRPARISKVTAADIKRVAEKYLNPAYMRVIVVGDAAVVEGDLGKLVEKYGLGGVEVRRAPPKKDAKKAEKKPADAKGEKKPADAKGHKKPEAKGEKKPAGKKG